MNDRIFLEALEIQGVIGIYEWERNTKQTIRIDLQMPANAAVASGSDTIEDTLNYKDVAKRIIAYVEDSSYMLVETLAENIAEIILSEFGVAWIDLSVSKPGAVRGSKNVGIRIFRGIPEGDITHEVFLSLGSNVEPQKNLRKAIDMLTERFGPLSRSTVYRNKAVGFVGDDFLNMVVSFPTREPLAEVKEACTLIEDQCGRTRSPEKFAARSMDIDLLLFGDTIVKSAETVLPRPEIMTFPFMLKPLAEMAGSRRHPQNGRAFAEIWARFDGNFHDMEPVSLD